MVARLPAEGGLSLKEQFNAPPVCAAPNRPFIRGVNQEQRRAVFFQPRCKCWGCPACARINAAVWTMRTHHGVMTLAGGDGDGKVEGVVSFLTLTSNAKLDDAGSVAVFGDAWNKLRGRARRRVADGEYLMIPERHADGRLHAHAVETFNLGTRWWKDAAAACGLGYIAEEEIVRTPKAAAGYVSKYLAKTLSAANWPDGFRRVRTSRGWPKLPELPPEDGWDWHALRKDDKLDFEIKRLRAAGFDVAMLNHRAAWDYVGQSNSMLNNPP